MEWGFGTVILIVVLLLFAIISAGLWLGLALVATGFFILEFFLGGVPGRAGMEAWHYSTSFVITALPLFILMGAVLLHSGVSTRLYHGASVWLEGLPGGLAHTNIGACAIFAAVSGSSAATAATIGTVAIPEMTRRGYNKRLIFGSMAAGGALGLLIPPSLSMIIYGAVTGVSVGQLFLGGFIPGILSAAIYMAFIAVWAKLRPGVSPTVRRVVSIKDRLWALVEMTPTFLLIFMILGGIYLGVTTPTEAAAVGALGAFIIALAFRDLTWPRLKQALFETGRTNAMILLLVMGAMILQSGLARMTIPAQIAEWLNSLGMSSLMLLIVIYVFYGILGMFFDGISMILLTMPVIYPIIVGMGYDPLWFGIVLTVLIELAQITPPVGINLYVVQAISKEPDIGEIIWGCVPFWALMGVVIALLTLFPILATWLPSTMMAPK